MQRRISGILFASLLGFSLILPKFTSGLESRRATRPVAGLAKVEGSHA